MANDGRQQTVDDFKESVNMTRKELEDWLRTDESKSVRQGDRDTPAAAVALSPLEWADVPVIERRFPESARADSARGTVYATA